MGFTIKELEKIAICFDDDSWKFTNNPCWIQEYAFFIEVCGMSEPDDGTIKNILEKRLTDVYEPSALDHSNISRALLKVEDSKKLPKKSKGFTAKTYSTLIEAVSSNEEAEAVLDLFYTAGCSDISEGDWYAWFADLTAQYSDVGPSALSAGYRLGLLENAWLKKSKK